MTIALIAHGGAGTWRPGTDDEATAGMRAAAAAGREVLERGGSALDAVCATVVALEDNPIFNAGTGAVLNFDGFCELDASVMESRDRWKREAEYLSALIAQVPPWSLFWWRCRDAVKAWWTALSGPPYPASKH